MNLEHKYRSVQQNGAIEIFQRNKKSNRKIFNKLESISGHGSSLNSTKAFRELLPRIIKDYKITSINDCPCGDFHWMSKVNLDGINYRGFDIVQELVEMNNSKFNYPFQQFNAIEEILPQADLIIARDFLFHLSNDAIQSVLTNFRSSNSTYLLTTTFDYLKANIDLTDDQKNKGWGWRSINLEIEPFNLSNPLEIIDENYVNTGRKQKLYKIN